MTEKAISVLFDDSNKAQKQSKHDVFYSQLMPPEHGSIKQDYTIR